MSRNNIIPSPERYISLSGFARIGKEISFLYPEEAEETAKIFLEATERTNGNGYPIQAVLIEGLEEEEYRLTIRENRTIIAASSVHGLHIGLESLRQLIYIYGEIIPCQAIKDKPVYSWRGFMLDCCRHFFPAEYVKKLIDAASLYHLSVFHWHLTEDQGWRIEIKKYPELTEKGSWAFTHTSPAFEGDHQYYTQDEIRDIVDYAAKRFITVVPELEMPGHASAWLKSMPELGCTGGPYQTETRFGVFRDILCAGNDKVFEVISDVLDEYCDLFPSGYIHIGGDEAPTDRWQECPKCRKRAEENGLDPKELQYWFSQKVIEIVKSKGRTPVGWDEIANPILQGHHFDKDLTLMLWRGKDALKRSLEEGHKIVLSRCDDGAYLDYRQKDDQAEPGNLGITTLRRAYSMTTSYPELENNENILGGQANIWSEKILFPMHATYMIFPRLLAVAEAFWTKDSEKCYDDFVRRLEPMKKELAHCGLTFDFVID